jgi:inorganic triphosphatase YgiF
MPERAAPDREIELKLRVRPEDMARLAALPALARGAGGGATRTLESVYYDTEDLSLRRRAVSLRVRRQGRRFVQTLKLGAGRAGTHLSRSEWEAPVAGREPDLAALPEGEAREWLGPVAAADLRPVFTAEIRRTTRLLDGGGSTVEVAIDRGEIRLADGAAEPVSELELELKEGSAAALYEIALAVAEAVPVRIETRTKSDRGYALATGEAPRPVKAARVDLDPECTAEQALERILRACLSQVLANEGPAGEGADPEGVHQMRVGLRRLRSALVLFRRLLPADQHGWFAGEVRWLASELGPAREWDVFLDHLMVPVEAAMPGDPALAALRRAAGAARARGYERARDAIRSRRAAVLALRLGAWLEERSWRRQALSEEGARLFDPVGALAADLLDRRHRQARRRGAGFAGLGAEARHELRIALKKLRYASEFFRSLHEGQGRGYGRYVRELAALQEALGRANDVATAGQLVRRLQTEAGLDPAPEARLGGGLVVGWHARGLRDEEGELLRGWEGFSRAKPFWRGTED